MSYRAVIKGKEYWRVGTSMLLFDLDNPLDIYTLVSADTPPSPPSQVYLRILPRHSQLARYTIEPGSRLTAV